METFYDAIGVSERASDDDVHRAFRERAKATHPDVSDSRDARRRFKRLKTARDVLTDETERARYDRLGHAAYLRRSGPCSGWETPTPVRSSGETGRSGSSVVGAANTDTDSGSGRAGATRTQRSRSAGTAAKAYYRSRRPTGSVADGTSMGTLASRLRTLGPWLLLDALLVLSSLATAGLVLSWGSLSVISVVVAATLVVLVLGATTLHLSVRTYA